MYGLVKRFFDIIMSVGALVVLLPVLALIGMLIKLDSKGSVIFTQRRIGRADRAFYMFKFRTMYVGTPEVATDKLRNSERCITSVGYYLRKYSLDELPQLLNILKGDMSIVGPRPALYNQYDLRQMRNKAGISAIYPGLTGWAQINGRDEIELEQKVKLDKYYLQHRSFIFDLAIIYRTIFSVSSGDGVSVSNQSRRQI